MSTTSAIIHCIPVVGQLVYAREEARAWQDTRRDGTRTMSALADRIKPLDDLADNQVVSLVINAACIVFGFAIARALQWSPFGLAFLAVATGAFIASWALRRSTVQRLEYTRTEIMHRFQARVIGQYEALKMTFGRFLLNPTGFTYPSWYRKTSADREQLGFDSALAELFPDRLCAEGLNLESAGPVTKVWNTRNECRKGLEKQPNAPHTAYWNLRQAVLCLRAAANQKDVPLFQRTVIAFEIAYASFKNQNYGRPASSGVQAPSQVGKTLWGHELPTSHIDIAGRKQAFETRFHQKFGDASTIQFPCQILISARVVYSHDKLNKLTAEGTHAYCPNRESFQAVFQKACNAVFDGLAQNRDLPPEEINVMDVGAYVIAKSLEPNDGFHVEVITSRIGELYRLGWDSRDGGRIFHIAHTVLEMNQLAGGEIYSRLPETNRTLSVKDRGAFNRTEATTGSFYEGDYDYDSQVHWNTHRCFMREALRPNEFTDIIDSQGNLIPPPAH